jgi:uncharacterized protein YdhG (YjbR/CyaY superfamily)
MQDTQRGILMEIAEYIDAVPIDRKDRLMSIIDTIKSLYPAAEESMKYRMPTYTLGEGWVAVANQKSYISLYTCSAEHLAAFKQQHPDIKTGKGCINFRSRDPIPIDDIKPVIASAMERPHGHK